MQRRLSSCAFVFFVLFASATAFAAAPRQRDTWEPAERHALSRARIGHSATALSDGRIVVIGGEHRGSATASIEILDPARGTSRPAGQLRHARSGHTAIALDDHRVLVAGGIRAGRVVGEAEIVNAASGEVTAAGTMIAPRRDGTAVALEDGSVLFIGGDAGGAPSRAIEQWTEGSGFQPYGAELSEPRSGHAAVLLDDGTVFISGGRGRGGVLASTELLDPGTASIWKGFPLQHPRHGHTATVAANGNVVIIGGADDAHVLGSTELYIAAEQITIPVGATLAEARFGHETIALPGNGHLLVFGGGGEQGAARSTEALDPFAMRYRSTGAEIGSGAAVAARGLWAIGGPNGSVAEKFDYGRLEAVRDDATVRVRGEGWAAGTKVGVTLRRGVPEPAEAAKRDLEEPVFAEVNVDGTFAADVPIDDAGAPWAVEVLPGDPDALPAVLSVSASAVTLTATPSSFPQTGSQQITVSVVSSTPNTTGFSGRLFRSGTLLGNAFVSPAAAGSVTVYLPAFVSGTPGQYAVEITRTDRITYQYACGQYPCGTHPCNPYTCCWTYSCGFFSTCQTCSTCYNTCTSWCTSYCTGTSYPTTIVGTAFFEVLDGVPPVISGVGATPSVLAPRNHKMVDVTVGASVTDNVDPAPTIRIASVSSNEGAGGGSGNTAEDWTITGPMTLQLRAEAAGTGSGRVYTITLEAADSSGNTSTATTTVLVPHDKRK